MAKLTPDLLNNTDILPRFDRRLKDCHYMYCSECGHYWHVHYAEPCEHQWKLLKRLIKEK